MRTDGGAVSAWRCMRGEEDHDYGRGHEPCMMPALGRSLHPRWEANGFRGQLTRVGSAGEPTVVTANARRKSERWRVGSMGPQHMTDLCSQVQTVCLLRSCLSCLVPRADGI